MFPQRALVDVIVHVISHDFEDTGQMQGPLFTLH